VTGFWQSLFLFEKNQNKLLFSSYYYNLTIYFVIVCSCIYEKS
jgi:hypothetical protein